MPKIILASGSAIRAKILREAGISFEAIVADFDEETEKQKFTKTNRPVSDLVKTLALGKAKAVQAQSSGLIIGADQVLEFRDRIFDKPKSMQEAYERLQLMRGHSHRLIGGICLIEDQTDPWFHLSVTELKMRDFSDEFLKDYLQKEGKAVLTSVGAYKFEGRGASLFESVKGDFFSVLGLSLLPLMAELRRRGALLV